MEETNLNQIITVKPFLRWAGGKSWLIKHLSKVKTAKFNNYHEAFLGGGAAYFYLLPQQQSFLSDLNGELIETYQAVKDNIECVIDNLKFYKNEEKDYYEARSTISNNRFERAARFIYLNQTSFNGIHRVNLKGEYNVPYGFRKKDFIDINALRNANFSLKNTTIFQSDFQAIIDNVKAGDLIFLDPPYTVSHNNNGFIKYNEKIFSLNDQVRLSETIEKIKRKDAYYILTNAAHSTIETIFEKGDKKLELYRANLVGGNNAKRGHTSEFVFTNIDL